MKRKNSLKQYFVLFFLISFLAGAFGGGLAGIIVGSTFLRRFSQPDEKHVLSKTVTSIEEESAAIDAVKKVFPSVVSIIITKDLSKIFGMTGPNLFPFDDYFEFGHGLRFSLPGGPQGKQEVGGGTGFIISSDGLILTNKHVVSDPDAEYTVVTADGAQYPAQVLATDSFNDIAIVKIDADGLDVVELGDSDAVKIGQTVIAIGNALAEYENSVTKGIISGVERDITAGDSFGASEILQDVLQTDAAINPGNSGGPLINLEGQVIGVNTAISQEGQLVGFAIPINDAKKTIKSVIEHGKIIRPYLGVRYIQLNKRIAKLKNLPVDYGALIVRGATKDEPAIIPGSPADKAGLKENDIILEVNGQKIDNEHQLGRELAQYEPSDVVVLKVLHEGKEKIIEAKLIQAE